MIILDTNKIFNVTNEEREKGKTNYGYKILNSLKDNWQLVGSIILIIMVWYYFNYLDTYCLYEPIKIIQNGGGPRSYASSVKARAGANWKKAASAKVGKKMSSASASLSAAPGKAADYAQRKVDGFKAMSGAIYQILFQVAMFVMMFIIFGPALALFVIMVVCFALLKQKVTFVKEL